VLRYPTELFEFVWQSLRTCVNPDLLPISPDTVKLSDGTEIIADDFICATGYEQTPTFRILPERHVPKMGVSSALPDNEMVKAADEEILCWFFGAERLGLSKRSAQERADILHAVSWYCTAFISRLAWSSTLWHDCQPQRLLYCTDISYMDLFQSTHQCRYWPMAMRH
jgi:hypothetical protein